MLDVGFMLEEVARGGEAVTGAMVELAWMRLGQ